MSLLTTEHPTAEDEAFLRLAADRDRWAKRALDAEDRVQSLERRLRASGVDG